MVYQYVAYNESGQVVKGKLPAANEAAANEALTFAGFRPVSLKPYVPLFSLDKLADSLFQVKPTEVILFFRQLAMLLESGTNIAASLELLQQQTNNRLLKKVLGQAISEVRGGNQLSMALGKYPKIFPPVYARLLGVGEQTGDLETVLVQIADYMERETATTKEVKSALMMPGITAAIAVVVVGLLVMFVLPSFGKLYTSMGAKLPPMASTLMNFATWSQSHALQVLLGVLAVGVAGYLYIRTPGGRYKLDQLLLRLPLLGRVRHLSELSRLCRSMSLLFKSGLPLPEAMNLLIQGCTNKVLAAALAEVRESMVKGEGLSKPMSRDKLFLPMMVQMVRVGEETGSLDVTLVAVARSYETEGADKMHSLVELIQPVMTVVIGVVIGVIAITLFSTIYGMTQSF